MPVVRASASLVVSAASRPRRSRRSARPSPRSYSRPSTGSCSPAPRHCRRRFSLGHRSGRRRPHCSYRSSSIYAPSRRCRRSGYNYGYLHSSRLRWHYRYTATAFTTRWSSCAACGGSPRPNWCRCRRRTLSRCAMPRRRNAYLSSRRCACFSGRAYSAGAWTRSRSHHHVPTRYIRSP